MGLNGDGRGARVLRLPGRGRLLVCTDLHGNLRDFGAMVDHFEAACAQQPETHLLFAGDLIHGPRLDPGDWQEELGEYYVDASDLVVDRLIDLSRRHPGRVHALLGNHEHAHLGGACTAKFSDDEAFDLEARMDTAAVARLHSWLNGLPLVAVAPSAGVVVSHAAPAVPVRGAEDIEALRYVDDAWEELSFVRWLVREPILGSLLWSRTCSPALARGFLQALVGRDDGVAVYGHVVVRGGYEIGGEGEQLVVSSSFGLRDADKRYLDLSLSRPWQSAHDLHARDAILPLY